MGKTVVKVHPEKCVGCWNCMLVCSFTYENVFQPSAARIKVEFDGEGFAPSFTDECVSCGTCARYCMYGALEAEEREKGAA